MYITIIFCIQTIDLKLQLAAPPKVVIQYCMCIKQAIVHHLKNTLWLPAGQKSQEMFEKWSVKSLNLGNFDGMVCNF